jgi:hypothetical protein
MPSRAKRIDRLNELITHYSEKLKQEKRAERKQEHKAEKAERRLENRRKFIKGALLDKMVEWGWITPELVMQGLDNYLVDRDRDLFGLPPRETETSQSDHQTSSSATVTTKPQGQHTSTNQLAGGSNPGKPQQEEALLYQQTLQALENENRLEQEKPQNQDKAKQQSKRTHHHGEQKPQLEETIQVTSPQPALEKPKTLNQISQDKLKEMFDGI